MTTDTPTTKTDDFDAIDFAGCLLVFLLFLSVGVGILAGIVFALRCAWAAGA